jgi:hypothetical protein
MDLRQKAEDGLFRRIDERVSEEGIRHPGLYILVEILLLCALAALIYGLVKVA